MTLKSSRSSNTVSNDYQASLLKVNISVLLKTHIKRTRIITKTLLLSIRYIKEILMKVSIRKLKLKQYNIWRTRCSIRYSK